MEREEGEMSDDNAMLVDDFEPPSKNEDLEPAKHTVIYKADKNGIMVTQLEKIDAARIEERARRFGLNLSGNRVITQKQIDELYENFGIESGNERHFRFDALHLNGVDGLTTREIFEYLEDYKPLSLERIDEVSCNIVCQDHISAALALLVHSREIKSEELKEMLAAKSLHHWREGMPHPKKDLILMRFATNGDKKMPKKKAEDIKYTDEYYDQNTDSVSKNPWGDLCKSWGVYDHQEIFQRRLPKHDDDEEEFTLENQEVVIKNKQLAMRLGKRSHKVEEPDDSSSDSEWKKKSKVPRMRMHADDEESKLKKKQPVSDRESSNERDIYAPLSIQVVNSKSNYMPRHTTKLSEKFKTGERNSRKSTILSRLGAKVVPADSSLSADEYSSDGTDDSDDHYVMSRVQKVNSKTSDVWSRLETKDQPETHVGARSDLRHMLKSRRLNKTDDLRGRISKSKQTNLRIEIDNNYVKK
ncbi:nuclear cap-binding protein subunit 3-like [Ostrinia nubilalis]|uniref:nuclear cap-binding protein subunit 3-like n=1 Tax=Ostrinia nubilalis TaxID=29057 RepID=UPI0030823E41